MDTKFPLIAILSIAVGVAIYQASGAAAILGNNGPSDDLQSGDEFRDNVSEHNVEDEGIQGNVNPEADSDIVGVILGGFGQFIGILTFPGMLSSEMAALGLPLFAAVPLGLLGNLFIYIGAFQVITNRMYE